MRFTKHFYFQKNVGLGCMDLFTEIYILDIEIISLTLLVAVEEIVDVYTKFNVIDMPSGSRTVVIFFS